MFTMHGFRWDPQDGVFSISLDEECMSVLNLLETVLMNLHECLWVSVCCSWGTSGFQI